MKEKKLTDEEIAKAILQSIEYSKTITYFDEWGNCKAIMMTDILDLIHRLQDENNQIKSNKFASWKLKFFNLKDELKKELAEHEAFTKKAKAEIEQLTEENKKLVKEIDLEVELQTKRKRQIIAESQEFIDELSNKNAELQKQVDELKAKLHKSKQDMMVFHVSKIKQAVKDTAKAIYSEIGDDDILVISTQEYGKIEVVPLERLQEIVKGKGMEVE